MRFLRFGIGLLMLSLLSGTQQMTLASEETKSTVSADEEERIMSEEQKELLKKISVNEKKIDEGDLAEWQIEVLRQYDIAMNSLNEKYPSHSFAIMDCAPKGGVNSYTTFWFTADGEEARYEMQLQEAETEGEDETCVDNYYGSLLKPEVEKELAELLHDSIEECAAVRAEFTSVKGSEYDEELQAQSLLDHEITLTGDYIVFLKESNEMAVDEQYEQMKEHLKTMGLTGSYLILILPEVPEDSDTGDELWDYVREQGKDSYVLRKSFSIWETQED